MKRTLLFACLAAVLVSTGCSKFSAPEMSISISDITSTSATINYIIDETPAFYTLQETLTSEEPGTGATEGENVTPKWVRAVQAHNGDGMEYALTKYTYTDLRPGTTYHIETVIRFLGPSTTCEADFTTLAAE